MTTIKFRGFRTDGKGWVEGLPNQYQGTLRICREIIEHPSHSDPAGTWIYQEHEIHPESLGQFTGKTDKNGKEIFTGDLLHRYLGVHWRVVFKYGHIFAESLNGSGLYLHYNEFFVCEIIGNQFEQE